MPHHEMMPHQVAFADRKEEMDNGKDVGIMFPYIIHLGSRKKLSGGVINRHTQLVPPKQHC